jgi:hypothetical protein
VCKVAVIIRAKEILSGTDNDMHLFRRLSQPPSDVPIPRRGTYFLWPRCPISSWFSPVIQRKTKQIGQERLHLICDFEESGISRGIVVLAANHVIAPRYGRNLTCKRQGSPKFGATQGRYMTNRGPSVLEVNRGRDLGK